MTSLGEIYGGLLPKVSFNYLLVFVSVFIFLLFSIWVYRKNKNKAIYDCYVFEKVGNDFRMKKTKIIRNISVKDNSFHLRKSNTIIPVTMQNAIMTKNGKISFFLIEQDDTYIPMEITDETKDNQTIGKLMANYNLSEVKKALAESVEKDNKAFAWIDKMSPYIQIVVPMVVIIISFIILGMNIKQVSELKESNTLVMTELKGVGKDFGSVASDFGELIEYIKTGHVATIPPG